MAETTPLCRRSAVSCETIRLITCVLNWETYLVVLARGISDSVLLLHLGWSVAQWVQRRSRRYWSERAQGACGRCFVFCPAARRNHDLSQMASSQMGQLTNETNTAKLPNMN
eukprot:13998551-Heterocapsa_arctica.AAC.1